MCCDGLVRSEAEATPRSKIPLFIHYTLIAAGQPTVFRIVRTFAQNGACLELVLNGIYRTVMLGGKRCGVSVVL